MFKSFSWSQKQLDYSLASHPFESGKNFLSPQPGKSKHVNHLFSKLVCIFVFDQNLLMSTYKTNITNSYETSNNKKNEVY